MSKVLEYLASKHDKWVKKAYSICKDYDLAQDYVQDLYLKADRLKFEYSKVIESDGYFATIIRNHIYDQNKRKFNKKHVTKVSIEGLHYLEDTTKLKELDDVEAYTINSLSYVERELLERRNNKESLREIAEELDVHYLTVFNITDNAKKTMKNNYRLKDITTKVKAKLVEKSIVYPVWFGTENVETFFNELVLETINVLQDEER